MSRRDPWEAGNYWDHDPPSPAERAREEQEERREQEREAIAEAHFEEWRVGFPEGSIDEERVLADVDAGLDKFDCATSEISRLRTQKRQYESEREDG